MVNKAVRGMAVLAVVAITAAAGFAMLVQNASGDFLSILKLGKAGVRLLGLVFIPLALYMLYKAV